jgi:catechol 2,3-dioxygenase-like lactoylglutathione lyase family enzyme
MSTMPTRISQIQLVMIPSTDQDRSVAFYTALGFEKRSDFPWGDGYRWVEVYPPSGTTGMVPRPRRQHAADRRGELNLFQRLR